MKNTIMLLTAMLVAENQAIKMRDDRSIKKHKEQRRLYMKRRDIYDLRDKVLKALAKKDLLEVSGYYLQKIEDQEPMKIYINRIKGYRQEICNQRLYVNKDDKDLECKGQIGLMQQKEINNDMTYAQARSVLLNFLNERFKVQARDPKKAKAKTKKVKKDYKIKERKLVELHRLRLVKDSHLNSQKLDEEKMAADKKKLEVLLDKDTGKYPKDKAILVWRAKDPEDRRRVIYKVEDGYKRYLISKILGLEKVYVDIIEEEEK